MTQIKESSIGRGSGGSGATSPAAFAAASPAAFTGRGAKFKNNAKSEPDAKGQGHTQSPNHMQMIMDTHVPTWQTIDQIPTELGQGS